MSTPVLADGTEVRTSPATARPLLFGAMAALSAAAAAIHVRVMFEHFDEYSPGRGVLPRMGLGAARLARRPHLAVTAQRGAPHPGLPHLDPGKLTAPLDF